MKLEEEWRIIIKDAIQREEIAGGSVLLTKMEKKYVKLQMVMQTEREKLKLPNIPSFACIL